jgi:hypothetical protein
MSPVARRHAKAGLVKFEVVIVRKTVLVLSLRFFGNHPIGVGKVLLAARQPLAGSTIFRPAKLRKYLPAPSILD